jgi:hypothetical protein
MFGQHAMLKPFPSRRWRFENCAESAIAPSKSITSTTVSVPEALVTATRCEMSTLSGRGGESPSVLNIRCWRGARLHACAGPIAPAPCPARRSRTNFRIRKSRAETPEAAAHVIRAWTRIAFFIRVGSYRPDSRADARQPFLRRTKPQKQQTPPVAGLQSRRSRGISTT